MQIVVVPKHSEMMLDVPRHDGLEIHAARPVCVDEDEKQVVFIFSLLAPLESLSE